VNRTHHSALIFAATATLIAAGCSSNGASLDPALRAAAYTTSEVELTADGGLGGFTTRSLVRGNGLSFLYTMHRICSVPSCQPAIDSAAGSVSAATADSLFAAVEREAPFDLNEDYGITVGAADMFTYTLRVKIGDRTKTIRADDGTMPAPMRRIAEALRASIAAARR
jgi:hypothetical protein